MQRRPTRNELPPHVLSFDEPHVEIGSRSVPMTEWEGEVLVRPLAGSPEASSRSPLHAFRL